MCRGAGRGGQGGVLGCRATGTVRQGCTYTRSVHAPCTGVLSCRAHALPPTVMRPGHSLAPSHSGPAAGGCRCCPLPASPDSENVAGGGAATVNRALLKLGRGAPTWDQAQFLVCPRRLSRLPSRPSVAGSCQSVQGLKRGKGWPS